DVPLQLVHGRAAVVGDVLARLLAWTGWNVTREYYVNDATKRAELLELGRRVLAHYGQLLDGHTIPAAPDDLSVLAVEIARRIASSEGNRYLHTEADATPLFARLACREMVEQQQETLHRLGVTFDVWFFEQSLHQSGAVEETLAALRASRHTYEFEGALWLRSTDFGDEQDRVLVRSNGSLTYLAADAAYHRHKFARGFHRVVDIWGPEHRAYVARTFAALAALGIDPGRLQVHICEGVRPFRAGETFEAEGAPHAPTLWQLLEEVGPDAARSAFLAREMESPLSLDIAVAKDESVRNLACGLREVHQRCVKVVEAGAADRGADALPSSCEGETLTHLVEKNLVRHLADFPEEVLLAAQAAEPYLLARYAGELRDAVEVFLNTSPGVEEGHPVAGRTAPLALVRAAQVVLANILALLGIPAAGTA
ncbi:MAG: arginine--tRNA ligase, partial [Armatimonadota bacterium]|nr:arginine--tRNA ligase [Armatimonadota bacterium]